MNAKVGSQEIPGVTGKFGLRVHNETGQRLTEIFPRKRTGDSKHPSPATKDVLSIIGEWNAKVGSQEIPKVTGKFGLRVQN